MPKVEVYTRCPYCGVDGIMVRRVKHKYPDAIIHKSGNIGTPELNERHMTLQQSAGIPTNNFVGIISVDGEVSKLREWI